jgi:ATP-binding protein involved in chromosome partitioning
MVDHVSVCDRRVKVRLALVSHDSSIPSRLESSIFASLAPLSPVSVAVEIVQPSAAPVPRQGKDDPWADQVHLNAAQFVIAVGAGKGGVGKSTVAVNLALALAREGLKTALLDADIYGPSLPILMGIEDGSSRVHMTPDKHIIPLEAHGIPIISFGFFLGEGSPAVWRGPMVSKAVKQFARGVAWPDVDVLVVDLPPGTGDVPLSLAQSVALSGAVIVTQPSRVSLAEAQKAAGMFRSLEVPLLGVVENMCGTFGHGAGRIVAANLGIPFLGEVQFDEAIIAEGDAGIPTVIARPDSAAGASFTNIAREVAESLGMQRVAAVNST